MSNRPAVEADRAISPSGVRAALAMRGRWRRLGSEALTGLVGAGIALYGATEDESLVPLMVPLYHHWTQRVGAEDRIAACERIRGRVEGGELAVAAMLPLLTLDPDVRVTTRAAFGYAAYMAVDNGDLLTGPKAALFLLELPSTPATTAGVFAALLALGDARVTRLLWERRDALEPEALRLLSHCPADCLFEATAHFWVQWLEELPGDRHDPRFGLVAAALVNQVRQGARSEVLDVERRFPLNGEGRRAAVLRRTPPAAFLRVIAERLAALAEREPEPRIVPAVIEIVEEAIREGEAWETSVEYGVELYRCAMRRGDMTSALKVLDVLREKAPGDPVFFVNSAFCLHELGQTAEARELLLGGPDSLRERPLYHYNLACYEARLGDLGEARRRLARAVELRPGLAERAATDPDLGALRLRVC
jgi:tetratricopeptide (TPR) repeat protein